MVKKKKHPHGLDMVCRADPFLALVASGKGFLDNLEGLDENLLEDKEKEYFILVYEEGKIIVSKPYNTHIEAHEELKKFIDQLFDLGKNLIRPN